MTKNETNEIIAEFLFGYKNKRFFKDGDLEKYTNALYQWDTPNGGTLVTNTVPHDYIKNWQAVAEKLAELKRPIAIDYYSSEDGEWVSIHSLNLSVKGDTIGEAICTLVVEYIYNTQNKSLLKPFVKHGENLYMHGDPRKGGVK